MLAHKKPWAGQPKASLSSAHYLRVICKILSIRMINKFKEEDIVKLRSKHFGPAIKKLSGTSDSLSMLLRIHLVSEAILEELIRIIYGTKAKPILELQLSYKQKLDLVRHFQLSCNVPVLADFVVGSLRKLNSLRNKLAHNLNFEVTNAHVYDLYIERTFTMKELAAREVHSNLKDFAILVLPSMLPYYEESTGDFCILQGVAIGKITAHAFCKVPQNTRPKIFRCTWR